MTTYSHKKGIREITDQQFSEGTTIDGNRIDEALEDVEDRVNNVRKGDISTRFVPNKISFGYLPCRYVANWYATTSTTGAAFKNTMTHSSYFTRFPWLPIKNDEYTTLDPQPGAPSTTSDFRSSYSTYTTAADPPKYDPLHYHNRWRYKGTAISGQEVAVDNEGEYVSEDWIKFWLEGKYFYDSDSNGSVDSGFPKLTNAYQLAWSQSWLFPNPVIVDDLFVLFRTTSRTYDAEFTYDTTKKTKDAIVLLCVDDPLLNTTTNGSRQYSSQILIQHQVDFSLNKFSPLSPASIASGDVAWPADDNGADAQQPVYGPCVRLQDLNIPIHANARVRLAIIVPQWGGWTPASSGDAGNAYGWANAQNGSFTQMSGSETTFSWAPQGCLTVLEEIVK